MHEYNVIQACVEKVDRSKHANTLTVSQAGTVSERRASDDEWRSLSCGVPKRSFVRSFVRYSRTNNTTRYKFSRKSQLFW